MKTSYILCIALAAALCVQTWRLVSDTDKTHESETAAEGNAAYDCIMSRSSCRAFTPQALTDGQTDSILRAAMAAPTAVNQQAWQFIVITERELLDSISSAFRNIRPASEAPMAIVPCGDISLASKPGLPFLVQDISAVSENILLAANSMGLGAVWCGIYPDSERVEKLSALLHLTDSIVPLCVIPVGYPKNELRPKDKYNPERIHFNRYD